MILGRPETPTQSTSAWAKLFTVESLPQLFQTILGLSSVFYISGYLCWAYYARENNLGFLPAIREQYFVAGFIPVTLLAAIFLFHVRVSDWVEKNKQYWKPILIVLGTIYGISLGLFLRAPDKFFQENNFWIRIDLTLVNIMALYAFLLTLRYVPYKPASLNNRLSERMNSLQHSFFQWYSRLGPLLLLGVFIFLFIVYADKIFPHIPREFGGPTGTPVQLDIKREDISQETLNLVSNSTATDSSKVIRTKELYMVFDGGDLVLLKENSTNSLLKIKREIIQGRFNCE